METTAAWKTNSVKPSRNPVKGKKSTLETRRVPGRVRPAAAGRSRAGWRSRSGRRRAAGVGGGRRASAAAGSARRSGRRRRRRRAGPASRDCASAPAATISASKKKINKTKTKVSSSVVGVAPASMCSSVGVCVGGALLLAVVIDCTVTVGSATEKGIDGSASANETKSQAKVTRGTRTTWRWRHTRPVQRGGECDWRGVGVKQSRT